MNPRPSRHDLRPSRDCNNRVSISRSVRCAGWAAAAAWAAIFPLFSSLETHRLWGTGAAIGYVCAAVAVVCLPRGSARTAAAPAVIALVGAVVLPLLYLVLTGQGQSEVHVIERSGALLLERGTPYLMHPQNVGDYTPYLPGMALFGIPRAVLGGNPLGDARLWCAAAFFGCLWAGRRVLGRGRSPYGTAMAVLTASPVVALPLCVSGVDLPLTGLCCLALALAARGRPLPAGAALALACSLKWTAWPAIPVAAALLACCYGGRAALRCAGTAAAGAAALILPCALRSPEAVVQQVLAFPTGRAEVATPARSPFPGQLLANCVPGGWYLAVGLLVCGALAVAGSLLRRPPADAVAAADRLALGLCLAFVLAPAGRFGYLALPIVLAVWMRAATAVRPARPAGPAGDATGRTLVITNDFPPRQGGIETFVHAMATRLPADRVVVYTSSEPGAAAYDATLPFPVVRDPRRMLLPTRRVTREAIGIARAHGCDRVWFGAAAPLAFMAPALRRSGIRRMVATTHGHEIWWARIPGARSVLRRIGDSVDVVTYLGRYTRDRIAPALGPHATLSRLVPGVDPRAFRPGAAARNGGTTILCVSRLVPRKGQDTLIRALPLVRQAVPDAVLVLVGQGPDERRLRRLARRHAPGSVVFAGGTDHAGTAQYYAAADVFAMPCRTRKGGLEAEGLGIVYLEAAACGLPVIAGNSGGAPDAVRDGETGLVTDGRRVAQVAEALVRMLRSPERAAAMGEAGRRWVAERWTWEASARHLERLLTPEPGRVLGACPADHGRAAASGTAPHGVAETSR